MFQKSFRTIALTVVGALAIGAALVTATIGGPVRTAAAQDSVSPVPVTAMPVRTITVVGEGKVRVEPDTARVTIGVEVLRDTVRDAADANTAILDAVVGALSDAGIADADVQTSGFSVYSERFGPEGPLPDDQVNYRVSNNVVVTVRDLEQTSSIIDAAIEAGANNIYGVEFILDDTSAVESEARAAAVESARSKADELAGLNGVVVGDVISISEVVGSQPIFTGFREQAMYGMGGGGGPTIQPGQVSLTMQLQITYAIEAAGE